MQQNGYRPKLLDLFCGAGGAAMGYYHAGFDVFGVDNDPKPLRHYPFPNICADALEYALEHGPKYDAIHASPPCQGVTIMRNLPWLRERQYKVLIAEIRAVLKASGRVWVLENVAAAKWGSKHLVKFNLEHHGLQAGYLCGMMFHLPIYFHRLFEANFLWLAPGHPKHHRVVRFDALNSVILTGHPSKAEVKRLGAMKGIDWMTGVELSQAIPPVYTEFIGRQLMEVLHDTRTYTR